jgi:hypothetical protein
VRRARALLRQALTLRDYQSRCPTATATPSRPGTGGACDASASIDRKRRSTPIRRVVALAQSSSLRRAENRQWLVDMGVAALPLLQPPEAPSADGWSLPRAATNAGVTGDRFRGSGGRCRASALARMHSSGVSCNGRSLCAKRDRAAPAIRDDRFCAFASALGAIAKATKRSSGSSRICAAAHDRNSPKGGVPIEACDSRDEPLAGTNADCRSHERRAAPPPP